MALHISGLIKRFGGLTAVNGLSFVAEAAQVTALIGPNGAGKTTALNTISGLLGPDGGSVVLGAEDVTGMPAHKLAARGLARTYQNLQMFEDMTVLEVVMVGAHRAGRVGWLSALLHLPCVAAEDALLEQSARAALHRVQVPEDLFLRDSSTLAYGIQRRVEIARALASHPAYLLLDEPAAGLNPRETEEMSGLIGSLSASGLAVVLVEHDMDMVMSVSDKVVVMNFGSLIASGTPEEVQGNPEVIRAYLGQEYENRTNPVPTEVENA